MVSAFNDYKQEQRMNIYFSYNIANGMKEIYKSVIDLFNSVKY